MLNLLIKDLKMLLFGTHKSTGRRIISGIFSTLMLACFIALETVLFVLIINKVKVYGIKPTRSIIIIFLFVISCIMIFVDMLQAIKLFFNEKDVEQLIRYPVTNEQIIFSKLIFLFISHYVTSVMFTVPIFIAYGSILGRTPMYYYTLLFYPALTFLVEAGIALLFVYPFKLFMDYLKKNTLLQFILSIVLLVGLSFVYSKVLEVFMDLVVNNQLALLFTDESIVKMNNIADNLLPISLLIQGFLGSRRKIFAYICMALGIFLIGVVVAIIAFNYFRGIRFSFKKKERTKDLKVFSVKKALLKKELTILFKDSNNIFSFTGLLVIQPFLMFLVINALNGVFTSGAFSYYILVIPNFIPLLDIVLIMLFTLIINSGANNYITAERKTMRIMKTIPVSVATQMFIKVLVPFAASALSLIVSTSVLYFLQEIDLSIYLFGTLLSLVLLLIFELVSLREELKVRMNKPRSTFLSSLYSYLLPIAFFVVSIYCSYYKLELKYAYLVALGVMLILGLPFVIRIKHRTTNDFLDLEMET